MSSRNDSPHKGAMLEPLRILVEGLRGFLPILAVIYLLMWLSAWIARHPDIRHFGSFLIPGEGRGSDFAAILLALTGIWYAVKQDDASQVQQTQLKGQLDELVRVRRDIEDQVTQLKGIDQSLSTRVMDTFPVHVEEIARFSANADVLHVLINCLDYGSFFYPDDHWKQHQHLIQLAQDRGNLRILVCGEVPTALNVSPGAKYEVLFETYLRSLRRHDAFVDFVRALDNATQSGWGKQFFDKFVRYWLKLRSDVGAADMSSFAQNATRQHLEALHKIRLVVEGSEEQINISDSAHNISLEFELLLQLRQYWFLCHLKANHANIRTYPDKALLFFWLKLKSATGMAAVFTFADGSNPPSQLSFRTSDHSLLGSFRQIFEQRWQESLQGKYHRDWLDLAYTEDSDRLFTMKIE